MRKIITITGCLVLLAVSLSSCEVDSAVREPQGQDVLITLNTGSRAGNAVDHEADYTIHSLRILGFSTTTGRVAFNKTVNLQNAGANKQTGRVTVKTGRFDIVFVANETLDPTLDLGEGSAATATLAAIRQAGFAHGAFTWNGAIPMAAFYRDVQVVGEDDLNGPSVTFENKTWKVGLDRLGVKVELNLALTAAQHAKWGNAVSAGATTALPVTFANYPQSVYVLPETENEGSGRTGNSFAAFTSNPSLAAGPGSIVNGGSGYTVAYPRIILPESLFADKADPDRGVRLEVTFREASGNKTYTGNIGSDIANAIAANRDYTLPRNTYVRVNATIDDALPDSPIDFTITVQEWDDMSLPSDVN